MAGSDGDPSRETTIQRQPVYPEVRTDPLTGDRVIVAPARSSRPRPASAVANEDRRSVPRYDPACPFCAGNESQTAEELLRLPAAPDLPWRVRVVANLYPALVPERREERTARQGPRRREFGDREPAYGRHEVVVETPLHDRTLADFDDGELDDLLQAYRARFADAAADESVRHIVIFRNQGALANASISHAHTQLAALGLVPPAIRRVLRRARRYLATSGTPLLHDLVSWEVESRLRLVEAHPEFVILVPFAPIHEYELWVAPRLPLGRFDRIELRTLREFGRTLRRAITIVNASLGRPDFNFILHTPPLIDGTESVMPWYAQIIPRRGVRAGFEMGLGVEVASTAPEEAAALFRDGASVVARA